MNQRSVQVCQPTQLMFHILQLWSLGCDSRKNSASSDDENNNERKSSKSQSLLQQGRQLVRQQSGGGGQGRNSMEKKLLQKWPMIPFWLCDMSIHTNL